MCLIIFAHQQHPEYPLLVAANRDEYYRRATAAAGFWQHHPRLLAGRDLVAGGTWLGITGCGRFAAITNHRNPPSTPEQPRSRGLLTLDFLRGTMTPDEYLHRLQPTAGDYAGFNLILGDGETLYYYSNLENEVRELAPGLYSLSNAMLDTPWPKQTLGVEGLRGLLGQHPIDHAALAATVNSASIAADEQLPDTGVGIEFERLLSAQFITSPDYGTRATTTLSRDRHGITRFMESNFGEQGSRLQSRSFCLNPAADARNPAGH